MEKSQLLWNQQRYSEIHFLVQLLECAMLLTTKLKPRLFKYQIQTQLRRAATPVGSHVAPRLRREITPELEERNSSRRTNTSREGMQGHLYEIVPRNYRNN